MRRATFIFLLSSTAAAEDARRRLDLFPRTEVFVDEPAIEHRPVVVVETAGSEARTALVEAIVADVDPRAVLLYGGDPLCDDATPDAADRAAGDVR